MTAEVFRERMSALLEKQTADIARLGWAAVGVFPTADQTGFGFTYTVGLTETCKHPELIVCGLAMDQAHGILAGAVDLIKDGTVMVDGKRYGQVLSDPYVVEARAVPKPVRPLNLVIQRYGADVEALQIVWPDADGRFPGEPGMDEELAAVQVLDQSERS